jgi:hypothetical protein
MRCAQPAEREEESKTPIEALEYLSRYTIMSISHQCRTVAKSLNGSFP